MFWPIAPPASLGRLRTLAALVATGVLLAGTAACGGKSDSPTTTRPSYPAVTGRPSTGTVLEGTGYRFRLPTGWEDITKQVKAVSPGVDAAGRQEDADAGATVPSVVTYNSANQVQAGRPTTAELREVADQIASEVEPISPDLKRLTPVTVDGLTALRQEGPATTDTGKRYIEQVWLVTMGSNFGFTFSFPTDSTAAERAAVVTPVLASVSVTKS